MRRLKSLKITYLDRGYLIEQISTSMTGEGKEIESTTRHEGCVDRKDLLERVAALVLDPEESRKIIRSISKR